MTWKRATAIGGVAGFVMGLLMFMVALAVVPSSLPIFDVIHRPMNSLVDFLDARFHFLADSDSDAHYVRYWLTSLLFYWVFIGSAAGLVFRVACGRRFVAPQQMWTALLTIAWLFIAGVLTWALFTIHSYGGHWGITQNMSAGILALALVLIALQIVRALWRSRALA